MPKRAVFVERAESKVSAQLNDVGLSAPIQERKITVRINRYDSNYLAGRVRKILHRLHEMSHRQQEISV